MSKLYQHIASALIAMRNCEESGNTEWWHKHHDTIGAFVTEFLPSGAGFDNGTVFDYDSKPNRLVFHTSFHHMNEGGFYDGWTDHDVIVTPSLAFGFDMKVETRYARGRDRCEIKEYISGCFHEALSREITRAEYCAACGVPDDTAKFNS